MRLILTCLLLIFSSKCFSQWTTLNIPQSGRHDDIFFLNENLGWAAGGPTGNIYKTTNGGVNWTMYSVASSFKYLRSIEFATPTLGFCGSLNSSLYKTVDGGATWTDIANSITPKPAGICGLSAPTPTVIYGCGIWSSPAYAIKSTNGGNTWTTINMSAYASALVDIHFISADTGYVSGAANPATDGGVILYTTDGGTTWTVKHKTLVDGDVIWKIQTPDKKHYFGSIESLPTTGNVRMVKSTDKGVTWSTQIVKNTYSYIQTIGFIDSLKGWTGGTGSPSGTTLLETADGGNSWQPITLGPQGGKYNRFFKINDSTAFLSGSHIYKYKAGKITGVSEAKHHSTFHTLTVSPNPASTNIQIEANLRNKTYGKLQLYSQDGKLLQSIYEGNLQKGSRKFSVSIEKYPPQMLYLTLKTNEDLVYQKIVKQ